MKELRKDINEDDSELLVDVEKRLSSTSPQPEATKGTSTTRENDIIMTNKLEEKQKCT